MSEQPTTAETTIPATEQQQQQPALLNEEATTTPTHTTNFDQQQPSATIVNDNNKRGRESEVEEPQSTKKQRRTKSSKSTLDDHSPVAPNTPVTPATTGKSKRARKPNTKYADDLPPIASPTTTTPTTTTTSAAAATTVTSHGAQGLVNPTLALSSSNSSKGPMEKQAHRTCFKLLTALKGHRWAWPFNQPVDPVSLNIPDYFTIVKQPMDLGTIEKKMIDDSYKTIHEFAADVRLVWYNCLIYNQPGSDVVRMAEVLRDFFEAKFKVIESRYDTPLTATASAVGDQTTSQQEVTTGATTSATTAPAAAVTPATTPNKSLQNKLSKLTSGIPTTPISAPPTPLSTTTAAAATTPISSTASSTKGRLSPTTATPSSVTPSVANNKRRPSNAALTASSLDANIDSRPMTYDEMAELSKQVEQLTSPDLAKVVDIIRSRAPRASSQASNSEIEIHLNVLDPVTLRMLEAFVKDCIAVRRQKAEARSRAAERAAETRRMNRLKKEQESGLLSANNNNNHGEDDDNSTAAAMNTSNVKEESGSDTAESGSDTESDSSDSDSDSESDNEKNIQPLSAQVQNGSIATNAAASSAGADVVQISHIDAWSKMSQNEEQAKLSQNPNAGSNSSWLQFREMSENQKKREQEFENLKRLKEEENAKKREMELQKMREKSSQQQQQYSQSQHHPQQSYDEEISYQSQRRQSLSEEEVSGQEMVEVNPYGSFASSGSFGGM